MIEAALFILAARENRKRKPIVTATEIMDVLGWEHTYSNRKGICISLPRNGFIEVADGCFTL
jgi:hypothetical protein